MEFDREEHGSDQTCENPVNTETRAPGTEEDHKSCEEHEEHQKSWSLERNWGFTLEELFRLALKFFKGTELIMKLLFPFSVCAVNVYWQPAVMSVSLMVAKQNESPFSVAHCVEIHCNNNSTHSETGKAIHRYNNNYDSSSPNESFLHFNFYMICPTQRWMGKPSTQHMKKTSAWLHYISKSLLALITQKHVQKLVFLTSWEMTEGNGVCNDYIKLI